MKRALFLRRRPQQPQVPFFTEPPLDPAPATLSDIEPTVHLHVDPSLFKGQRVEGWAREDQIPQYEEPVPRPAAHKCFLPNDLILSTAMNDAHGLQYERETGRRFRFCWCPRGGDHPAVLQHVSPALRGSTVPAGEGSFPDVRKHPHPFTSELIPANSPGFIAVEEHIARTAAQLKAARDALLVLTAPALRYDTEVAKAAGTERLNAEHGLVYYPDAKTRVALATHILKTEGGF